MKFYEKAIAEFKKAEKERCKNNSANFKTNIRQMVFSGKCDGISCQDCPVKLYERESRKNIFCTNIPRSKIIEIITSEV